MFVKYLIKADGTVVIPNTSKDSLSIMQQTFLTGERVIISSPGGTPVNPYRTIIRGGSHIEPILYTQSGSAPNAQFSGSILLQDVDLTNGGISVNKSQTYASQLNYSNLGNEYHYLDLPITPSNYPSPPNVAIVGGGNTYPTTPPPGYTVQSVTINEGVSLTITLSMKVKRSGIFYYVTDYFPIDAGGTLTFRLYKNSLSNANIISEIEVNLSAVDSTNSQFYVAGNQNTSTSPYIKPTFSTTIPNSDLVAGDIYFGAFTTNGTQTIATNEHKMEVTQYPIYTSPFTSSGYNTIWGYGNKTTHPYVITSSKQQLVDNYGNPDVRMKSVDGTGFNQIQLPWDIKIGDEFRFEGREDWSYMVKNIYAPTDSGSGRIFETGSIEVHFNANLPVSASSNVFNLDHFLIRRYVDDAAQNIITGFRPQGSTSPYLIKPEFVVPELNKNIDEVILDLTQKGLIT
jgi:hypothetical protein